MNPSEIKQKYTSHEFFCTSKKLSEVRGMVFVLFRFIAVLQRYCSVEHEMIGRRILRVSTEITGP